MTQSFDFSRLYPIPALHLMPPAVIISVIAKPEHTIDHLCPTYVPFTFSLTQQDCHPTLLKYMTSTTPASNSEGLFHEAISVQITISVREPAGNRWYAQIRII